MKYKIIVDKQSRENPSTEKREYEIDIEELRCKGNVADSLIITKDEDYVIRRLSINEYNVLKVLDEPIKEPLKDINIELFEGDNYIYLFEAMGNKFYAEYLVKNDFTDMYVTVNQMNSAINQTAEKIELNVTKTLEGYATTEKMNSKITQTAEEINSEVSKKVGNDEIISKINQSAEEVTINADKINIDGKAVHFSTEIAQTFGPYTEADKERMRNIIMGEVVATDEDYTKYDIDGDGIISAIDLLRVTRAILNGNGYFNASGTFCIDPYSAQRSVKIYNGNVLMSTLSVLSNYFNEIDLGGTINFLEDNYNKTTGYINKNGFSLDKKSGVEIESGSYIGIMNVNGEDVGAMSLSSKHGSIFADTSSSDGGAYIGLTSYANYIQTIIKANGITTPTLTQTSREETKKNFEKFENGLDVVKQVDIYKYNLRSEEDTKKKHIGFVIGDNYRYAHEITAEDDDGKEIGVDTYSMVSVLWKAIQEQQEQIEELQKEIKQ